MKKRKIKLFASVASLAMVAAVMGVGVWAASSQTVNVTSEIKFESTSIAADINLAITGFENTDENIIDTTEGTGTYITGTAAKAYTNEAQVASFTTTDGADKANNAEVQIVLKDGGSDGLISTDAVITYTFSVTPTGDSKDIQYKVTVDNVHEKFDYKIDNGALNTNQEGFTTGTLVGEATSFDIVVTFTVDTVAQTTPFDQIALADLADISIALQAAPQA